MAKHFASLGRKVLLVDADLRNPSLHQKLNGDNSAGLSNYLTGACSPPEVMQKTEIPNLAFIASGPLPPNAADLLGGPRVLSLLSVGCEVFDLIIDRWAAGLGSGRCATAGKRRLSNRLYRGCRNNAHRGHSRRAQTPAACPREFGRCRPHQVRRQVGNLWLRLWQRATSIATNTITALRTPSLSHEAPRKFRSWQISGRELIKIADNIMTDHSTIWMAIDLMRAPANVRRVRAAALAEGCRVSCWRLPLGTSRLSVRPKGAPNRSEHSLREAAAFLHRADLAAPRC